MAHYNFRRDLEIGQQAEKEAAEKLKKYFNCDIEFNHDSRYDIKTTLGHISRTYEVKTDLLCGKTGNLALEYECRGKPSGITTTEADYWIYKLDDGFYRISTKELKNLIAVGKYSRMVTGGDKGSNTKMFLFKLPLMKENMCKL